jgi:transposase
MWCIGEITPAYRAAMDDVLATYERPYNEEEPVVCFDEKSLQLLNEKQAPRPMRLGAPLRRDYEYIRCGTTNIFCAVEPKVGRHFTSVVQYRKGKQFAEFIEWLARRYPKAKTIHLVMDNLNTHRETSLIRRYGAREGAEIWKRFTPHYTPIHGSWLNQAEIEIGLIGRQCLKHRRFPTSQALSREVRSWNIRANAEARKINWTFTRAKAQALFADKRQN